MTDKADQVSNLKNNISLFLIIGTFVGFFIAGRFFIDPSQMPKINKGNLIVPHISIDTLGLLDQQDQPYDNTSTEGQWSMLYISNGECDKACQNALYTMRQVRIALGKDADRVRRILVHTSRSHETLRNFVDETTPGMVELKGQATPLNQALQSIGPDPVQQGLIFLVSPDGMLFMWYPSHADIETTLQDADHIHEDLTRTLKGSIVG